MRPIAVGLVLCLFPAAAAAGLYTPHESFNFEIDADGFAKPIQYSGGFESMMAELRELLSTNPTQLRAAHEARVRERQARGPAALPPEELAAYTADLIRLGRTGDVVNLLLPLARDPRHAGFLTYAHLAVAHALRAEWSEAAEAEGAAVRSAEFPRTFGRLTKVQLTWLKRVEREYYFLLLFRRADEARRGPVRNLREDPDTLFPAVMPPKKRTGEPLKFAAEDGSYVAGRIAEEERKKLPPDAIAIVQQLLLWHPQDTRLYWLLAELYNAEGDVETASKIMTMISFDLGYTNPRVRTHNQILTEAAKAAAEERAAEAERVKAATDAERERLEQADRDYRQRVQWIVAVGIGLALILVYYQFREVARRLRRAFRGA